MYITAVCVRSLIKLRWLKTEFIRYCYCFVKYFVVSQKKKKKKNRKRNKPQSRVSAIPWGFGNKLRLVSDQEHWVSGNSSSWRTVSWRWRTKSRSRLCIVVQWEKTLPLLPRHFSRKQKSPSDILRMMFSQHALEVTFNDVYHLQYQDALRSRTFAPAFFEFFEAVNSTALNISCALFSFY